VDEVKIDVIRIKQFKRGFAMLKGVFVANGVATAEFGGDEQRFSLNASFFDGLAHFVFIGVGSSGIDVRVAGL
jgi:hypothetical protein